MGNFSMIYLIIIRVFLKQIIHYIIFLYFQDGNIYNKEKWFLVYLKDLISLLMFNSYILAR